MKLHISREEEFREKLKSLLFEYDAEISLVPDNQHHINSLDHIEVWIPSKYENGEWINEAVTIDLGRYCNKDIV